MTAASTDPTGDPREWEEAPPRNGVPWLPFAVVGVLIAVGLTSLLALHLKPAAPGPTPPKEGRQDPPEPVPLPPAETPMEKTSAVPTESSSSQGPDEASFLLLAAALPADAQMYFDVKLRAARRAPVWEALAKKVPSETLAEIRERLADLAAAQFDDLGSLSRQATQVPEEFLDNITRITGAVASESGVFVVGLQTRDAINWSAAIDVMRTFSSQEIAPISDFEMSGLTAWSASDDADADPASIALVRYRDNFALLGAIPALKEALAAMRKEDAPDAGSFAARARAAGPYSALVITSVGSGVGEITLPHASDGAPMSPLLSSPLPISSIKGGRITLQFSDTIGLTSANDFGDSQQAVQFKGMLDGMLGLASMMTAQQPDIAQMIAGITTGMEGDTVTVRLEITPDQIAAICQLVLAETATPQPAGDDVTVTCEANLRAIYAALTMHTMEHDGTYPTSLTELADSLPDLQCLWSPLAGPREEADATSYVLRADLRDSALAGDAILAREPIVWLNPALAHGAPVTVLYADGHVQRVRLPEGADPLRTFRAAALGAPSKTSKK